MADKSVKFDITAKDRTGGAFSKVKKGLAGLKQGAAAVATGVAAMAAATAAAFGLMARDVLKTGDQIHKTSIRIGASTEALSQLKLAADLSGVEFNTLTKAMQYMTRSISEATAGMGTGKDALEELGLSAKVLNEMKPEDQLEAIADAMVKIGNDADRVRLAERLFGARGAGVLQMMEEGAAGIRKMREEADRLGLTLSQEGANRIAGFNDEMTKLKASFYGIVQEIVVRFGPAMSEVASWLKEHLPAAIDVAIDAWDQLYEWINKGLRVVLEGLAKFYDVLGKMPGAWGYGYRQAAAEVRKFNEALELTLKNKALIDKTKTPFAPTWGKDTDIPGLNLPKVAEAAKGATKATERALTDMQRLTDTATDQIGRAFSSTLVNIGQGFESFRQTALNVLNQVISEMLYLIAIKPLIDIGTSFISGIFGGFFAEGGAVSAGTPYIVGEKGPELFVPGRSGEVIANKDLGGGNLTVNMNIQALDSRSVAMAIQSHAAQITGIVQGAYNKRGRKGPLG